LNGTPIPPWEMIAYLQIFVNKDLVRELKEGTYSRGLGVLDIHVMLPSHVAEWLKAIDAIYTTRSIKKLQQISTTVEYIY
jgi:hypothetical protein